MISVEQAVLILKKGEPVAIPTETVYGLAAPIFQPDAIKKIFFLKGRPEDNPLIAHVSNLTMVEEIAEEIPPTFHDLIQKFWPGPLTIVLPKKDNVPIVATGGLSSIGVRMPSHRIAQTIIESVGVPLVAPSANLSGKPSPTSPDHVWEDFGENFPVVDGGVSKVGIESTVVSLVHEIPTLLRPGSITKEEIEEVLKLPLAFPKKGERPSAPGMKYRHYAPRAEIRIVEKVPPHAKFVLQRKDQTLHSQTFYANLRKADRLGADIIWVLLDPVSSKDEALMNRLLRASGTL